MQAQTPGVLPAGRIVERHLRPRIEEALADTPVVVLQGARQVGKSTLTSQIVRARGGTLVTLDDDLARDAAQYDPDGFVDRAGLLAIDEVQRAPSLILAIKRAVDRERAPGRFLLTGSARLQRLPGAGDTLAGRAESLDLYPLSQGELEGSRESFVDALYAGRLPDDVGSGLGKEDYLERVCAGGYPEVLRRGPGRRRAAWFDSYVERVIGHDAPEVSALHRLADLPKLLRLIAGRNAAEFVTGTVSSQLGIPARTLPPYLRLLETVYLIHVVPAWSTNLSTRVVHRPRVALLDTGLAARLVNASPRILASHRGAAGMMLEGFVLGELRRQLAWAEEMAGLFHFRDRNGAEVDAILETPDGRVAAIEVKAGATVRSEDFRWLGRLRDGLGDRFVAGIVLHTGPEAARFADRLVAAPMSALWRWPP